MNIKIIEYKGYRINYDTFMRRFQVLNKSFGTQTEAEAYIDRIVSNLITPCRKEGS